ncbi:hypothetical protein J2Z48_000896 [Croceifilum oryzae]|uniref:Uncharacterized protein n=1 Tax=Croceifilum oryzae TaxID=1553429 RepID=A0AAJ1TDY3_9BACL|nr:hypothetical protein [Croceifilum oryzae]MDQ0416729.1 hypothetical protein [Croceifilum oryzae]
MAVRLSDRLVEFPGHANVCFIHACAIHNWAEILDGQLKRLCSSGLYQKLDAVFVNIVTNQMDTHHIEEKLAWMGIEQYDDTLQFIIKPDMHDFERSTLAWLQQYSTVNPQNVRILYFHVKGLRYFGGPEQPNVADWRNVLETVVIDHHTLCMECLGKADACGLQFCIAMSPHFSGNFWWANSQYIKRLPADVSQAYPPSLYHSSEMWILSSTQVKFCNIYNTGWYIEHYYHPFPNERIPTQFNPSFYDRNGPSIVQVHP